MTDEDAGNPSGNNPTRSAILTHIRHELRTPLNAIIGYTEMLLEDAADSDWDRFVPGLESLHGRGKRLLELINAILAPSSLNLQQTPFDLKSFGADIREKVRAPLDEVLACANKLIQEAEQQGCDSLSADLNNIQTAGLRLLAFIQEVPPPGQIKSEVKTTVSLQDMAPTIYAATERTPVEPEMHNRAALQKTELGSLLVVDDNAMNRDILSRCLMRQGHVVAAAGSGREALAMLSSHEFDLVLLDIMMPGMDGYEVLSRLKDNQLWRNIPVIFISALDDTSGKVKAFKAGGVDYITKPFEADEVLARVENQLKIARLQKALERRNQELINRNDELARAQKQTEMVFSALAEVLPGTILDGKYRLEQMIGAGGFGAVYRATHLRLNRQVAVKIFRPTGGNDSPEGLERFRLEGVSASRITHPNAVVVLDSGISAAGMPYLVMELLEGHTVADELKRHGALPPGRAIDILISVCEALAEAHEIGIVHRDIKPDNIFLHHTRDREVVKVVDFGIAKMLDPASASDLKTIAGAIVGTPVYIAPERFSDQPYDGQADIYSLGVVFYQMLCGQVPFQHAGLGPYALALMQLTKEPTPIRDLNPNIPPELERIVMRTLLKDPRRRPTARELAQEARALRGSWPEAGDDSKRSTLSPAPESVAALREDEATQKTSDNDNMNPTR